MSKPDKISLQTASHILQKEASRSDAPSKAKKRIAADVALKQSRKRFQTVFRAAPIGIAIANPEGYFIEVNRAFTKMLGYRKSEMKSLTFVDITYPEDREETRKLSEAVRQGKINSYQTEKRYLKKDKNGLIVETPEAMFTRVARTIAQADVLFDPKADIKQTETQNNDTPNGSFRPRYFTINW